MDSVYKKLKEYADSDWLPMHMPGHKRRMGIPGDPYLIDITEIDGFDNLHHAGGLLLEAERRAASVYGAQETHYLVNGSTAGILAAISGCTTSGGTLLMARNCHKSAYHAVMLRGLNALYLYPEELSADWSLNGPVLPECVAQALEENRGIQAVLITSPTYDGVVSDVEAIAEIVHAHGLPLIVDEAHGAHFPFSPYFPKDSNACGADVVVHSLHKTLPFLTQTALLHLNGPRIDRGRIRRFLSVYQTSSPSYVLMAGMDEGIRWIRENGAEFERFWQDLQDFREETGHLRHLRLAGAKNMDESRIVLFCAQAGISGSELAHRLRERFRIEVEMACSSYICAIASVADSRKEFSRFFHALEELDRDLPGTGPAAGRMRKDTLLPAETVCTIGQAEERRKRPCPAAQSLGQISGGFVTLYPPGIPLLAPGERITGSLLERFSQYSADGLELHGLDGNSIQILAE